MRFTIVFCLLFPLIAIGQTPTVQDCSGATPVCQDVYTEPSPYSYSGEGSYTHEIYEGTGKLCIPNESNGVWYIFTAQTDGLLKFSIMPDNIEDDYDWAVFNVTNANCKDLASGDVENYLVSSNTYGRNSDNEPIVGYTGANSDSARIYVSEEEIDNCNGNGTEGGPAWNGDITVTKGNTYILYVSNWDASDNGYTLDYSSSTAVIYDDVAPEINEINTVYCGQDSITVEFSENILCSSVIPDDFSITDSNGLVYEIEKISSENCNDDGEYDKEYYFSFSSELEPGNYIFEIINGNVSDLCGNAIDTKIMNFEVEDVAISSVSKEDITDCEQNNSSITVFARGGDSLKYSSDGGQTFFDNDGSFTELVMGTYIIIVKNEFGCESSADTITIIGPSDISVSEVNVTDIEECAGDETGTIEIIASSSVHVIYYSIDNGESFQTSNTFDKLTAGNYSLQIKDENNCRAGWRTVVIEEPEAMEIADLQVTDVSCNYSSDGAFSLEATGGTGELNYSLDDEVYADTANFPDLIKGEYVVSVIDENDCISMFSVTVDGSSPIEVETLQTEDIACNSDSECGEITVSATGGTGTLIYRLNNSAENTEGIFTNLQAGIYLLTITDEQSCEMENPVSIEITELPCLTVPEFFTPNNDGINDTWEIDAISSYPSALINVYNRWSKLVFASRGEYTPWNGTYESKELPQDSYFYYINLNDGSKPQLGHVTIIR